MIFFLNSKRCTTVTVACFNILLDSDFCDNKNCHLVVLCLHTPVKWHSALMSVYTCGENCPQEAHADVPQDIAVSGLLK